MPFQLTIAKGIDSGKSFVFSVAEVRIGRTSDNDIVLRDEGISRRHARLLDDGQRCFLEDLKSANGTRVNGVTISGRRELHAGDRFSVGPVLFVFERPAAASSVAREETRLLTAYKPGDKLRISAGRTISDDEVLLFEAEPTTHGFSGRARDARGRAAEPLDDDTSPQAPRTPEPGARGVFSELLLPNAARPPPPPPFDPEELAQVDTNLNAMAAETPSDVDARLADDTTSGVVPESFGPRGAVKLSAAERARIRRQAGDNLLAHFKIYWAERSPRGRFLLGSFMALCLFGALATVAYAFMPKLEQLKPRGPEPEMLSRQTIEDSFGLGPDVAWTRADMKVFRFNFVSPTRAVAVLHLQAKDVSADEVALFLNGAELGMLPADVSDARERDLEFVLPPRHLKREAENQLVLDNLRNPPGSDSWRIQKLWLEIIPVPELTPAQTRQKAEELARQGRELYERRDVGADNLFKAWKAYRHAWVTLEALEEKPELELFVRDSLQRIARELDQQCSRLLLEVHRSTLYKNRKKARATLQEILRYFPTNEHRCNVEAEVRMAELSP